MYNQKIELRHLRYFVAVAQELHFSRAAEKLHIAQPPLSQQIRQLERIVGVRLFERNRHSVTLTNAGQVFLMEILPILEQVEGAIRSAQEAHQGLVGKLSVGYFRHVPGTDTFLPDVVALYRQRFPAVDIRLREILPHEQRETLHGQHIQIEYTVGIKNQDMATEFNSETILQFPMAVVCAPQHRLAAQPSVLLRDIVEEPFICSSLPESDAFYEQMIRLCGFSPRIAQKVSDISMILGLVAANCGITMFPVSTMLLQRQGIVIRPLADANITFETLLTWRRQETSPLVEAFRAVAREVWSQQEKKVKESKEMQELQAVDAANSKVHPNTLHIFDTTRHQP
jgi:DNA-binding transcriptional LysR family regulator